jgi:chemotaxis signal transduction protein
MRPLPVDPVRSASELARGASCIRGEVVPVVDLGALAFGAPSSGQRRFVTIRSGARVVALAVDAVEGIAELVPADIAEMPLLLEGGVIERIATVDDDLVHVLRAARLLTEAERT